MMETPLNDKRILITGGTGSLGRVLVRRLLSGEMGKPRKIVVFSRDEAKQNDMRIAYQNLRVATDETIYANFQDTLRFRIGDVRDYASFSGALGDADVVFNAAALKQVPTCEYFPQEAVATNIQGPTNLVRAIRDLRLPVQTVIGISTDKAVKPVNVMGMTKAIQERIISQGNLEAPGTRFAVVRYGNVLASRGSVVPLFHQQIRDGGPITVTDERMTRFLLTLDDAVDLIFDAVRTANPGETYIPRAPSAHMMDLAKTLIGERNVAVRVTGIRPGEKIHEIMITEEEVTRTYERGKGYVIAPILPELQRNLGIPATINGEFSSADNLLDVPKLRKLLTDKNLLVEQQHNAHEELLR